MNEDALTPSTQPPRLVVPGEQPPAQAASLPWMMILLVVIVGALLAGAQWRWMRRHSAPPEDDAYLRIAAKLRLTPPQRRRLAEIARRDERTVLACALDPRVLIEIGAATADTNGTSSSARVSVSA